MSIHFYTITHEGKEYVADAPVHNWASVVAYFGVPRENIRRGGDIVRGEMWTGPVSEATAVADVQHAPAARSTRAYGRSDSGYGGLL